MSFTILLLSAFALFVVSGSVCIGMYVLRPPFARFAFDSRFRFVSFCKVRTDGWPQQSFLIVLVQVRRGLSVASSFLRQVPSSRGCCGSALFSGVLFLFFSPSSLCICCFSSIDLTRFRVRCASGFQSSAVLFSHRINTGIGEEVGKYAHRAPIPPEWLMVYKPHSRKPVTFSRVLSPARIAGAVAEDDDDDRIAAFWEFPKPVPRGRFTRQTYTHGTCSGIFLTRQSYFVNS